MTVFQSKPKEISIASIEVSDSALRGVQSDSEEYQQLLASVKERGVLLPIRVMEIKIPGTDNVKYELIDGRQRFSAAREAGWETISASVVSDEMSAADITEEQIVSNTIKVTTRKAELARAIKSRLASDPSLTISQVAKKLHQSETWIRQILSLTQLHDEIQELVDADKITLTNAVALSLLPIEEQIEHVDAAQTESFQTFVPKMKERKKELAAAAREGRDSSSYEFTPTMSVRKANELKSIFSRLENGEDCPLVEQICSKAGNPAEAVQMTLAWVLNYDEASQQAQKEKYEERQARRQELAERKKLEKQQERERKAAEAAVSLV